MSRLNKDTQLPIRMTLAQKRRCVDAAKKVSRERGERVDASTLAREILLPAIDRILEGATPAAPAAPAEAVA